MKLVAPAITEEERKAIVEPAVALAKRLQKKIKKYDLSIELYITSLVDGYSSGEMADWLYSLNLPQWFDEEMNVKAHVHLMKFTVTQANRRIKKCNQEKAAS